MDKKNYIILQSCDSPQFGILIKDKTIPLTDEEAKGLLKKKPPVIRIKLTTDEPLTNEPLNKTKKTKSQGGAVDVKK